MRRFVRLRDAAFSFLFLAVVLVPGGALMATEHSYVPDAGFVPDAETAIGIAEAVLTPIYGADAVKQERPFTAELKDGVWTVVGSMRPNSVGGVGLVEVSKSDGRILRVSHGR